MSQEIQMQPEIHEDGWEGELRSEYNAGQELKSVFIFFFLSEFLVLKYVIDKLLQGVVTFGKINYLDPVFVVIEICTCICRTNSQFDQLGKQLKCFKPCMLQKQKTVMENMVIQCPDLFKGMQVLKY